VALRPGLAEVGVHTQKSDWIHSLLKGWSWHWVHWRFRPVKSRVIREVIGTPVQCSPGSVPSVPRLLAEVVQHEVHGAVLFVSPWGA